MRLIFGFVIACIAYSSVTFAQTTTLLTPTPIQRFVDNNGLPCVGCKLFTYAAGTTTKLNVYTDSTGSTLNTDPVIFDARGEPQSGAPSGSIGVWLVPGTAYKFVFSPATDTDPPTNPFWTIDNVSIGNGTVHSVTAGTCLTGGIITTTGTISLVSPLPVSCGGTGLVSEPVGAVLEGNGTNTSIAYTAPNTSGFVLTDNGPGNFPTFKPPAVSGTVTSVTAGGCLSGGTITTSGTISLTAPVSVPCGGTGDTTLTADNVLIGNGTGAVQFSPPVQSGFVLTDNGPGMVPTFQASGGGLHGAVFTNTTTFTVPAANMKFTAIGAGGGLGVDSGMTAIGGAAGGASIDYATGLSVGSSLTITVGVGGTSCGSTGCQGGNGTATSIGGASIAVVANGGGGSGNSGAGAGGTASGGSLNFTGNGGGSAGAATGLPGLIIGHYGFGGGNAFSAGNNGDNGVVIAEW